MESLRELAKVLVVLGCVLAAAGLALLFGSSRGLGLPFRLGRLPGDIFYQAKNSSFYFPVVTCVVVSALLTLVLWLVSLFRK